MIKFKKTFVSIGLSVIMSTSFISPSFASHIAYENINEEIISSGVTYKNILKFTRQGWLNLNSIFIDLDNNNVDLKLLQSEEGLSTRETLSSMTKKEGNVVASMNADFFFMQTPSSPTGAIVRDGKMVSSPVIGENLAAFHITEDNEAFADYWDYNIYVTTDKGRKVQLGSINKYRWEYRDIMLIDRNWASHSPGATEKYWDMVEIVVKNDKVVEVRSRQPSVEIPEDGYILLSSAAKAYELFNNFEVGDIVTIHTDVTPNIENMKLAFGGGTVLVKNGQVAPFTQYVGGANPRTAIGITEDRSKLILLTVDGRHRLYKGVDGKELANILIELGSHEAIIMDGGGSTSMMARGQGEFDPKIINNLSEGVERRIVNGIAVKSSFDTESLQGIKTEIDNEKSFIGASREINIKAFDRNYNPLNVDKSRVNLSLKSGEGFFKDLSFTPTKSGKAIIEAEYMGATSEVRLDVLADLAHIEINSSTNKINNNQSLKLNLTGVNSEGYSVEINPKDVVWKDLRGLGSFKDGVYIAGNESGITKLEAKFQNYISNIDIAVGSNTSIDAISDNSNIFKDKLNKAYEVEGDKFFVHSGIQYNRHTLVDRLVRNKIGSIINNNHEMSFFTGPIDALVSDNINKEVISARSGYKQIEKGNNLILQLDNSKDGLRQTDYNQWPWLQNLVRNTNKDNIFVVMSKPIFGNGGFSDDLEADLLMDTFTQAHEKGKRVFVLYEGEDITVDVINGVRYISTGKYSINDVRYPSEAFRYIEFNINDKEVTYQIKSLFE